MDCMNLKMEFGSVYRVRYEESYCVEHGENARLEDPWLMIIPCRNGHIFPWGGRNLAASTNRLGPVANALKALPFVSVAQEGSDGVTVVFHARHFDTVAKILRPSKRRRLSPEERVKRTQRLSAYWVDKAQVRSLAEPVNALAGLPATSQSSGAVCG